MKFEERVQRADDVIRPYSPEDVERLRSSVVPEHTLARLGAKKLRDILTTGECTRALGALTGNQAVQQVRAGLKTIYVSGWQCASDANLNRETFPDMSLYASNSVPMLVDRINRALSRADQIERCEKTRAERDWFVPVVADAEAGFGGPLGAHELAKQMVEAGAAAVHFEDQLASAKKCGHLSGKALVPTSRFIKTLVAARLAFDVCNVETVLIARTDAESAKFVVSDVDERDRRFIKGAQTDDGFFELGGDPLERCLDRALAVAPYSDALWMETSSPDLGQAREFARGVREKFPSKWLCYNLSPSFNWRKFHDDSSLRTFIDKLESFGYGFVFVTLAGWHALNHSMFKLAMSYKNDGMLAYAELQDAEHDGEQHGFTALKHQREAGVGYFDAVLETIEGRESKLAAYAESTEAKQF